MFRLRFTPPLFLLILGTLFTPAAAEDKPAPPKIEDFTFIHISDTHIGPHVARLGPPEKPRGEECIKWICEETRKPQNLEPFHMEVPAPEFGIVTGDLTEYGVIDDTWDQWEKTFSCMNFPLYVTTGNHDNTWTAIYQVMRKRHGGENYSFDKHGCHFAMISSASPQEPLPSFDGKTRAWLKADLDKLAPGTPVFIGFHHPPYSDEFAPAEMDTFLDLIKNYNVVLLLYGHGHGVSHWEKDGVDGVMGGSTFGGKNEGYSIVSVKDGKLRVAYRYMNATNGKDESKSAEPFKKLLEKALENRPVSRMIARTRSEQLSPTIPFPVCEFQLTVGVSVAGEPNFHVLVDQKGIDGAIVTRMGGEGAKNWCCQIPRDGLTQGLHLLTVQAECNGQLDQRSFIMNGRIDEQCHGTRLDSGALPAMKSAPLSFNRLLLVAATDGLLRTIETTPKWIPEEPRPRYERARFFTSGAEILGTPVLTDDLIVFGSGDGFVYAIDKDRKEKWKFKTDYPAYAQPTVDRDRECIYIGDNGGRMHALTIADGKEKWVFERADFSIESAAVIWKDYVVFGAWDGYVYALNRSDGKLAWKSLGPESSKGKAARYFSPADCSPVPIGDKLFVCDRGYKLGVYDYEGKLVKEIGEKIAAIGPSHDEKGETTGFYARGTEDKLWKFDQDGEKVWQVEVAAGRFPIPPTEYKDKVYVCSNIGLLSALDAKDGKLLWQYQCTPGFYVMAPVTVGPDETCYVAGMDGSLTAVRHK